MQNFSIEQLPEFDNHDLISFFFDKATGLKGFIAIYNTNLGPAVGATRFWQYRSEEEALRDALRLSKAMTYKCALAGIPYGGGKAVIIGNPDKKKTRKLLRAYAKKVSLLGGNFYTGEDVGMNIKDVEVMAKETKFVIGKSPESNDPPFWTALGAFYAMQAGLKEMFGKQSFRDRTFAIKGLGKVGKALCRLIYERGGHIVAADINAKVVESIKKEFPKIEIVSPREIHKQDVDVYSPCALSGDLNVGTISQLQCKLICGCANSQLASVEDGRRIYKKGILYIPDYMANAGGVINVVDELHPEGYSRTRVEKGVKNIKKTTERVIKLSKRYKKPTNVVADELAERIFRK